MSKTTYHISLKGYVGGWDFNRSDVDKALKENDGKSVNVLIDSLGGSLATGLSISAAFKNHGDVHVHFVGLNASAATIASLGAKHISIDTGAMYLVHKCSTSFFEWGSMNSDQFSTLIKDCEKIKADLDKLDLNCAQLYAARCKRKTEDLLELMKVGGWLTAKEALEWGFVDEITDLEVEKAPRLTDALASAMATEGLPIPNIPFADSEKSSAFTKFLTALTAFFSAGNSDKIAKSESINSTETSLNKPIMNKTYKFLSLIFADKSLTVTDGQAVISEAQLDSIESALADRNESIEKLKAKIADYEASIKTKDDTIADLQNKLAKKPGESTTQIVTNGESTSTDSVEDKTEAELYCETVNSARKLFNSL